MSARKVVKQCNAEGRTLHQGACIPKAKSKDKRAPAMLFIIVLEPGDLGNPTGEPQVAVEGLKAEYKKVDPDNCTLEELDMPIPTTLFGHPDKAETYDAVVKFVREVMVKYPACVIANTGTGVLLDLIPAGSKHKESLEDGWDVTHRLPFVTL